MLNFLTALQQADSAFPSGSFAFSNGIEGLAALGCNFDVEQLAGVFELMLRHRWVGCERVALVHAWRCGADPAALTQIDRALEAAILPRTLREGSRKNGAALLAAHARIGSAGSGLLRLALLRGELFGHLATVQGAVWSGLDLAEADCVLVSGYSLVSAAATAAVRLGYTGVLAAQQAIKKSLPIINQLASSPIAEISQLTGALPWLDIACARQETAALRLFSS